MTSAELRRIVGAMTERPFCMCGVGRFASEPCAGCLAKRTLANHADALVALVEACERQALEWTGPDDVILPTIRAVKVALAVVHGVK